MKALLTIVFVVLITSCSNNEAAQLNDYGTPSNFSSNNNDLKIYRKKGIVLPLIKNDTLYQPTAFIWSSYTYPRDTLYTLEFSEKVIVYGETGDYLYLAPEKDSTKLGYLMKNWIVLENAAGKKEVNTKIKNGLKVQGLEASSR